MTTALGHKYVGEWKNDKCHGKGTLLYPDKKKYVGQFKEQQKHGKGTMTYPDGRIEKGDWKNDEFIK